MDSGTRKFCFYKTDMIPLLIKNKETTERFIDMTEDYYLLFTDWLLRLVTE